MVSYPLTCKEPANNGDECLYPTNHVGGHSFEPDSPRNREEIPVGTVHSFFDSVSEFHRTAEVPAPARPTLPPLDDWFLSVRLIDEEFEELSEAWHEKDIVGFADAICDLAYVVLRVGYIAGLDINSLFSEVHRSNMSKFPGGKVLRREDGKILKPDSWTPPNLEAIIRGQHQSSSET